MKKEIFDERQQFNRYKYGTHAFYILLFSIIIYEIIKFFYPISISPTNEMTLLIFTPISYFWISTILTNSFSTNNKNLNFTMLIDIILSPIFLVLMLLKKEVIANIAEYKLYSNYISTIILCIESLLLGLTYMIKSRIDKNNK